MNGKIFLGGAIGATVFLALCFAAVVPWYHVVNHGYVEGGMVSESSFYLWEWRYSVFESTYDSPYEEHDSWKPVQDLMFAESLYLVTAMASVFLSVMAMVLARPKIAIGCGIIAVALMVSGGVYFMMTMPEALSSSYGSAVDYDGFVGKGESTVIGLYSWGPLLGWYLLIIGVVLELSAVILIDLGHKGY